MKTKIKLFFWSFLAILFVWLYTTSALELGYLKSEGRNCLASKENQNLIDRFWEERYKYYFDCITNNIDKPSFDKFWRKIQVEQFESKTYELLYSERSYTIPFRYKNGIEWWAFSDYFKLWKDEKGLYVFSKFKKGENTIYRRNMLRITDDTPVKVKSNRGSAVYKQWYVLNGLQLYTKQWNQGRLASVIDNTYILDWYGFVVDNRTLRVMDTYSNKLYKYKTLTDNDLKNLPRVLFYNLYNQVPDDIYDVVWNKWSYWYFYWKDSEYINYEMENSKKGTEEDLKKIQQDLKNSIQILNKEDIDFYLGMQPEELGISTNPDLPKNQDKWENNENNKSYEENLKEYNSCTSYRNNIKTYTTYNKECYKSLLDSAPLTWAVNHKKLLAPWNAVVNWNGEWELDIDTEDRICLQFKDRKAVYKQKRSKQWEEFQSISKENWLNPSGIVVDEKCWKRPERSWSFLDKFWSKYQDRREYIELKVACLASFWVAPEVCKKLDDPNSKNSIIAENNKGRDTLNSWQNKPLLEPKEYILKAWNVVYDPFYSWYVNTNFLPAQCGSYKNDAFSIFAYLFLFSLFLYFIKFM